MRRLNRGDGLGLATIFKFRDFAGDRAGALRLYFQGRPDTGALFWRINGFRARLLVWTPEEWEQLESRPQDARLHPSGVWCALRMDEAG